MMDPVSLPPPSDLGAPVPDLARELARHLGRAGFVSVCVDLLAWTDQLDGAEEAGAGRAAHADVLRYLTGFDLAPGSSQLDPASWRDYWVRTWGARGLLHVWDDSATDAVVAGLGDEHWRPAEMCLKVVARHDVAGAGDRAAALARHPLPRVRVQAMRALGAVGDTEHLATVRERLGDDQSDVRRQAGRALERLAIRLDLEV